VDQGPFDEAILIGADSESEQWVSAVGKEADAPYTVLEKVRRGDRDVEIAVKTCTSLTGERRCSSTTSFQADE
jgi:ribose-phosphate pyrophosphokinase